MLWRKVVLASGLVWGEKPFVHWAIRRRRMCLKIRYECIMGGESTSLFSPHLVSHQKPLSTKGYQGNEITSWRKGTHTPPTEANEFSRWKAQPRVNAACSKIWTMKTITVWSSGAFKRSNCSCSLVLAPLPQSCPPVPLPNRRETKSLGH